MADAGGGLNGAGGRKIAGSGGMIAESNRSSGKGNFALEMWHGNCHADGMATTYIPNKDTGLRNWANNFSTLCTANYAAYGITLSESGVIAAATAAYDTALELVLAPETKTAATVAAKDSAKAALLAVVRPFAQRINLNAGVTDQMRAALGITIRKIVPTPVPQPQTAPSLSFRSAIHYAATLAYTDPVQPDGKAKPYGVVRVELFVAAGTLPAIDPSQATYFASITKAPFTIQIPQAWVGKTITVYGRYSTRSGPGGVAQVGPFSAPLVFTGV